MPTRPVRAQPKAANGHTTTLWQTDLAAGYAVHLSGFAVRFSPNTNDRCPSCCMMVKHSGRTWLGCPDGVPLDLAPGELHEWVRQGAYAFLAALHAAGGRHVV